MPRSRIVKEIAATMGPKASIVLRVSGGNLDAVDLAGIVWGCGLRAFRSAKSCRHIRTRRWPLSEGRGWLVAGGRHGRERDGRPDLHGITAQRSDPRWGAGSNPGPVSRL